MNAGIVAAVLMAGALALISIPVSLSGDEASSLAPDSSISVWFPEAIANFGPVPALGSDVGLLIVGPDLPFTRAELSNVQELLLSGGRVVVLDSQGAGRQIINGLETSIELTGSHIFSPIQVDNRTKISAVGLWSGALPALQSPVAVKGGEPLLVTDELSWLDVNDDGVPSITEPRGVWAAAAHEEGLLVVGSEFALHDAALAPLISAWLDGYAVVVDEHHRKTVDPLGMAPMMSGQSPGWVPIGLLAGLVVVILWAYRPRLHRRVPKRRPLPLDKLLAELT